MGRFYRMADIIPEGTSGKVQVKHFTIDRDQGRWLLHPGERISHGRYAQLVIFGAVIMSDTDMELRTNLDPVLDAKGDVLIAGLGLGMILLPILARFNVTSVTVVEKNPDVIALIEPAVRQWMADHTPHQQLTIIQADIKKWRPDLVRGKRARIYDYVYFDIWTDICLDNLADMHILHGAFRPHLRKGGKMASWQRDHLIECRRTGRWR